MPTLTLLPARSQAQEQDLFANNILDPEIAVHLSVNTKAGTPPSLEAQIPNEGWQELCRVRGWFCHICSAFPEPGNSLGYEDGLCPTHRLNSQVE
jgi:hypothetical protein